MSKKRLSELNLNFIDGDRGENYPKKTELQTHGDCIFLNNKNLENNGLNFGICDYISKQKDDSLRAGKLKKGDLVLSTRGSVGSVGIYTEEHPDNVRINSCMIIVRNEDEKVDNDYLYHFFKSSFFQNQLNKIASGSIQKQLPVRDLKNITVILHPLHEQQKIASVLSALDGQIELNNQINRELEDLAQTLYNYWFVQFEFPNKEGKPYKSSGGKMVWNDELKREIPVGWEVKNILELVNWIGGTQPPKSEHIYEWREGYIRFIQNRDYQDNSHITYIKQTSTNKVCNEFDILMDKYGEAGKVRFGIAGAYNVALAKLEVINPDSREYIRSFFNDKNILEYLKNASIASTRASLNAQTLGTIKVCYPTKDLLCKFETIAAQSIATILQNRQQNQELTQLRDYLLPLLMNGQVTVSDSIPE